MSAVTLAITALGVAAGLLGGALAGWRGGAWALGRPKRYWGLNAAAMLGSLGLDIAGLFVHQAWLSYGALGLMAGLITGLKYGYQPSLRMWETPHSIAEKEPELMEEPDKTLEPGEPQTHEPELREQLESQAADAQPSDADRA